MRALVGFLLVLFFASACGAQERGPALDVAAFRDAFIAEVRRADSALKVKVLSDDEVEVSRGNAKAKMYLGNLYADYLKEPGRLSDVLQRLTAAAVNTTSETQPTVDKAKLVAMLRPTSYDELPPGVAGKAPFERQHPLTRPFAGDLKQFLAVENGELLHFPTIEDVRNAAIGPDDEVWSLAMANTRSRLADVRVQEVSPNLVLVSRTALVAGLMLEDQFWTRPEIAALGPRVAVTVGKNVMLIGNADDSWAFGRVKTEVRDHPEDWLSDVVFIRQSGRWSAVSPDR